MQPLISQPDGRPAYYGDFQDKKCHNFVLWQKQEKKLKYIKS
jgi:hypothetical protein